MPLEPIFKGSIFLQIPRIALTSLKWSRFSHERLFSRNGKDAPPVSSFEKTLFNVLRENEMRALCNRFLDYFWHENISPSTKRREKLDFPTFLDRVFHENAQNALTCHI